MVSSVKSCIVNHFVVFDFSGCVLLVCTCRNTEAVAQCGSGQCGRAKHRGVSAETEHRYDAGPCYEEGNSSSRMSFVFAVKSVFGSVHEAVGVKLLLNITSKSKTDQVEMLYGPRCCSHFGRSTQQCSENIF